MPYKDPTKKREHARLRMRKFRLKPEVRESEKQYRRDKYHENPEPDKIYFYEYCIAHPEKRRARQALNNAIAAGRIKKESCSKCGSIIRVNGHHKDYSKPFDVIWFCTKCHMENDKCLPLTTDLKMARGLKELQQL